MDTFLIDPHNIVDSLGKHNRLVTLQPQKVKALVPMGPRTLVDTVLSTTLKGWLLLYLSNSSIFRTINR